MNLEKIKKVFSRTEKSKRAERVEVDPEDDLSELFSIRDFLEELQEIGREGLREKGGTGTIPISDGKIDYSYTLRTGLGNLEKKSLPKMRIKERKDHYLIVGLLPTDIEGFEAKEEDGKISIEAQTPKGAVKHTTDLTDVSLDFAVVENGVLRMKLDKNKGR